MDKYPDYRQTPERPDLAGLMRKVESLGVSCELGLIQRHCGIEALGLFRFGRTPVDGLIRALQDDLAHVGAPDRLRVYEGVFSEYFVAHRDYGFELHTYQSVDSIPEDELLRNVSRHLGFLARKLRQELQENDKLFVFRSESHAASAEGALRLAEAMGRFGSPVLLWVELTQNPAKFGTAEWTVPGRLITGYLDWFAKTDYAAAMSFDCWAAMLAAAVELWEATPEQYEARLSAARQARANGDHGTAFDIWSELMARASRRTEPFLEAAGLLRELHLLNEAQALLTLGLARFPDDAVLAREYARLVAP